MLDNFSNNDMRQAVKHTAGRAKLEASGNAFASSESLYENIEKKANKICGVNGFYYIENSDPKWHGQTSYSNGMAITASYQVLTKTISCK